MKTKTRTPQRRLSLTTTLAIAFFVLSALVLFISSGLQLWSNVQAQSAAISAQQQFVAQDAAKTVSSFVQEQLRVLEITAGFTSPLRASAAERELILDSLLGLQPAFRQVALLDAQDRQTTQASRLSTTLSGQFTAGLNRGLLNQTRQGQRYISPIYIAELTGEPLITVAVPATNVFGDFEGTLAAELNLKFMWDLVDQVEVGQAGYAYVVDRQGNLIAFSDTARVLRAENVRQVPVVDTFVKNPAAEVQDVRSFTGVNGMTVVGTYVPLGTPEWAVVIELPWLEAYRDVIWQGVIYSAIALVMSALAGLIGVWLARRLAVTLVKLTRVAGQVAGGQLALQADLTGPAEVISLATAFNSMTAQLRQILGNLEQRVAERTRDLALASEVSRNVSQVRNLDTLLDSAVELIRSRFDLYYTQIYLADASGTALDLIAGTGSVGAELKQRSFRLPIGPGSINGTVAAERRSIIVPDTAQSPVFRPNPLLPDTRSEAAVPVMIGDRVLGVLDMQSAHAGTFTAENLPAFEILAGQLAVAIENASLFGQVENARAEVEQQMRRLARTGWEEYLNAVDRGEQISRSYETEGLDRHDTAASIAGEPAAEIHMLSVPIAVIGEPIGTLRLESHQKAWTEDEADLVEAVAQRVAQQIENIRLLEQAEQYRREAQEAARRLTRESWEQFLKITDTTTAYVYDGTQVIPAPAAAAPPPDEEPSLAQPITVYGETVGQLAIEGVEGSNQEAAGILNSVAAQLSMHIENLRLNEQTKATLAETRTLYETSARLNAAQSLAEALQVAAAPAIAAGADSALLFVFDINPDGKPEWMEVRANWARAESVALPIGVRFYLPTYPLAQVWIHQPDAPAFIDDLQHDPRIDDRLRGVALQTNMHAYIAMPLVVGGRWVGLISITWTTPHRFAGGDAQLYRSLAAQAAAVIDNRLLFAQTQTALAESRHLYEASRRLAAASTLQEVLATVVESVPIPAVSRALIFAYQRDMTGNFNGVMVTANWYGGYGAEPEPVGRFYAFEMFQTLKLFMGAEPAFFDDGQTDPRIEPAARDFLDQQKVRGLGILPLWVSGRQLGVMAILCEQPHHFTENEVRPYTSLAQQMAIAVENRRLFEQMQLALSETEDLYRASTRLNVASTPEESLRAVVESVITPGMMAAFLFAYVLDESGKPIALSNLAALDGEGRPLTEMTGVRFPQISAQSPLMVDDPKLSLIEDIAQEQRLTEEDRARLWGARAMAVIPLRIGSRWIGSMTLTWSIPKTFSNAERRLYNSLAAQAATTLDNQLLFKQTQKRAERESVINLIAQKIQSATSVEGAIQTAVRELGQAFKARRTVVELGNGDSPQNGA